MNKDPKKIINEIFQLVTELGDLAGVKNTKVKKPVFEKSLAKEQKTSGATGGLRTLTKEGYMDTPRILPEIIERLKEDGRHYSNATISMALLSLVRERVLMRFRDKGKKIWKYVIRK